MNSTPLLIAKRSFAHWLPAYILGFFMVPILAFSIPSEYLPLLLLPVLMIVWAKHALVLRVFPDRIILRKGILARQEREIYCSDVRTVETAQGPLSRLLGIGTLKIATAGTGGFEYEISGLRQPHDIKDLIMRQKRADQGSAA